MKKRSTSKVLALLLMVALFLGIAVNTSRANVAPAEAEQSLEKVETEVLEAISAKGSSDFVIEMAEHANLKAAYEIKDWSERGWYVYNALKEVADRTQKPILLLLDQKGIKYQSFFAGNEIAVTSGDMAALSQIAALDSVEHIRYPRTAHIDPITSLSKDLFNFTVQSLDWGISDTNADEFWSTFGVQGDGIVVANIDTGVQWNHPALDQAYKCGTNPSDPNCWYDPSNTCGGTMCDNMGHGTHTMGTMVGDDDPTLTYQVGMAPNAQWIACKGCETNDCSDTALNACADWILAPNSNPDNRPEIVNNSWGGGGGNDWYQAKVVAWRAAGIFPAFSAGNSGPGCSTLGSPGDYQESFGTAAHSSSRAIASFSSRGPGDFGDDPYTKPNISAPGDYICSSVPGSGWDCTYSGTSMASPHSAGAVALLWSCNSSLIGDMNATFELLQDTADPAPAGSCGAPASGEGNYTYGYGYLNVLAAGQQVCSAGTITGSVTSGSSPVEGATVTADNGAGVVIDALTGADGIYTLNAPAGIYTVTATKYGYDSDVETGVEVVEGEEVTVNFTINPLPSTTVSGVVYDTGVEELVLHGYPLYASIHITAPGFDQTIYSDPITGVYSIDLVSETEHTFEVTSVVSGYEPLVETVTPTTDALTHDIGLEVNGNICAAPGYLGSGVNEGFESLTFPAGWVNYDYLGNGQVWQFDDPGGRGNLTPGGNGGFAIVDSDNYGSGGSQDTGLRTPMMDFSEETTVTLDFDTAYNYFSGDSATVRVSVDNGANWTNVWSKNADFVDHVTLDISAQAAGHANVIVEFKYVGSYDWYWEVDDVLITPMNCELIPGGAVAGFVTDGMTDEPIIGADVYSDTAATQSFVLEDDPDNAGIYWLFQPTDTDPENVDFTASKDLYADETVTVSVVQDAVTQQDFALGTGELTFDPTEFEFTMAMGDAPDTATLTIGNTGTSEATFELVEKDQGFTPLNIPAFTGELPEDNREVSLGRAPEAATNVPRVSSAKNDLDGILSTAPAYAMDVYPGENLVYIPDTSIPGTWEVVGSISGLSFFAGDFVGGDFDTIYAANYDNNGLYAVDAADGTATLIGTMTPPGGTMNGLSGTPDGTMYGIAGDCTTSYLVTVDITSGMVTTIGSIPGVGCGIDLAYNTNDDMIYVVDLLTDSLFRVDPATAAATLVGSLGVGANYAQGMDFEEESGVLYWAAYTTQGELRVIDTTTGASTLIGAFPGGAEVDCLAFPTGGSADVPWLSENPVSGTVPADDTVDVTITVDPADLGQPGDYAAALKVKHNTPYTYPNIPVILHLVAPEDFGTINGMVNGLEACDVNPAPIEGATVNFKQDDIIIYTTTTLANGYYSYSMPAGEYDIEVIAEGFVSQTVTGVDVVGGSTVTQDFELRLLAPCLSVDPESLEETLVMNTTDMKILTIMNSGAAEATFELLEIDGGFQPLELAYVGKIPSYQYSPEKDLPGIDKSKSASTEKQPMSRNSSTPLDLLISEGFEGVFPPTNWAQFKTNPDYTWEQSSDYAYEGSYGASVPYDYEQDEWLLTPELALAEGTLSFYSMGSIYWCRDTYDNCDLNVWLVVGDVGGEDDIFVKNVEEDWPDNWIWTLTTIDLESYLPGVPVRIGFQYVGDDGADIGLDSVILEGVEGLDVPWLSEDPMAGTVPAGGSLPITVTFDATGLDAGDYLAALRVHLVGAPNLDVPVTLHVVELWKLYLPLIAK